MKKRILASFLAAMMAVSCFTACSTSSSDDDTSTDDTSTDTSTDDDSSSDTDEDEDITLTIAVQQTTNVEDWETNHVTGLLEEGTGYSLDFEIYPSDSTDLASKVALLVSAGADMPDIFCFGMTDDECFEYGSKGALVATTDYFSDEEIMPYFNSVIPEDDQAVMLATSTTSNGEIYSIPRLNDQLWNTSCYRMFVDTSWLESLGAELPTTTDEFYDLCVRMRDEDPNGNGVADEIAIMGSYDGWGQDVTTWIMNAFEYVNPDQYYFAVEDGEVYAAFATDAYYDGIVYMKNLVDEGLLDPLTFTQDQTSLKSVLGSVDTGVVGFTASGSYNTFKYQDSTVWNVTLCEPLTGPDGWCTVSYAPNTATNYWMITSSCENVEAAVILGDYFYQEEICFSARFGVEGVNWSTDPEVTSTYMAETYDALGLDCTLAIIENIWGSTSNDYWPEIAPAYRSAETGSTTGYYLWVDVEEGIDQEVNDPTFTGDFYLYHVPNFPDEVLSYLPYTEDQTDSISIIKTDIDAYVEPQLIGFITGARDLSEWDAYVAELYAMGLQEYIDVNQEAYDLYLTF